MFFVLLRPIFCGKWKIAPPIRKEPPPHTFELAKLEEKSPWILAKTFFFFYFFIFLEITQFWAEKTFEFWISAEKSLWILAKTFFFFGDHLILGGKNFQFPIFPRHFISNFGQIVWNWFKVNENSSQGRLHTSHSFKIAPPFSKSWLRACTYASQIWKIKQARLLQPYVEA